MVGLEIKYRYRYIFNYLTKDHLIIRSKKFKSNCCATNINSQIYKILSIYPNPLGIYI